MMEKGDFAKVQGLQSDAGKKLNGAFCVILGNAMTVAETTRYPILLFALRRCDEEEDDDSALLLKLNPILVDAPKKKIKVENLAPVVAETEEEQEALDLFRPAALSHIQSTYELGEFNGENKHIQLLLEQCHKHFPDDLELSIYYAKFLVGIQSKVEQGAKILRVFLPQVLGENFEEQLALPPCYEDVSELYKDFCFIFLRTGEDYLQDAMDCAVKICGTGTDPTTGGRYSGIRAENAKVALQAVQSECSQILNNNPIKQEPYISGFMVDSSDVMIKLEPEGDKNPELVSKLASAYGIAEDFVRASKLHRKTLALEDLHFYPGLEDHAKSCLVLSQLQCPGMPLADAIFLFDKGSQARCIKKSDTKVICIGPPLFPGGPCAMKSEDAPPEHLWSKMFLYTLPRDPNDPKIFPAWLLEMTKPEEEKMEEESMTVE